jgi:hypothetical protein
MAMAPTGWHDVWPLFKVNDPALVWARQPTLLLAEVFFLVLFLGTTWHAFLWNVRTRAERRRRVALWAAAVVGGACIELCTVLKRDVGNFYHSQATVMLFGLREPLYMLVGCYGFFNYIGCAVVWEWNRTVPKRHCRGGSSGGVGDDFGGDRATVTTSTKATATGSQQGPWTQALTAGLIGSLGWDLLNTLGLKLLWWTWHNDEPLYKDRRYGVPIASSFWIFSSITSLSMVFHWWCDSFRDGEEVKEEVVKEVKEGEEGEVQDTTQATQLDAFGCIKMLVLGTALGPLATMGVMNAPFSVVYHPFVTAAGINAAFPFAIFRSCGWTALIGACFHDPDDGGSTKRGRDGFAWLEAKTKKLKEMMEGSADGDGGGDVARQLFEFSELKSSGVEDEDDGGDDEGDEDQVPTLSESRDDIIEDTRRRKTSGTETDDVTASTNRKVLSTWLPLALVGATCLFAVGMIYGSTPETSVRVSFGQPVTFDTGKCMSAVEASFWGGFERKKYVCIDRLDEDRDVYRPCQQNLPAEQSWRQKQKLAAVARDMSIVDDAWFPLCGTEMSTELQHALLFEVSQLCVACLAVYFCGQPASVRKKVHDVAISDLGAMSILLIVSLAMLNPPYDEQTPRAPITASPRVTAAIHSLKWSIVVSLATWIMWDAKRRWRETF